MQATTALPATAHHPDLELARRHRYGDPEAFAEIYARYSPMVYNLVLRLAGRPEEAADLAQEIFLRIHRSLGRFRGRSSLKTWIYRVAVNHCRNAFARRRPQPQSLAEREGEGWPPLADPRRDPEQMALAADAGRRLELALAALPPVYREAVLLRDAEGLSYEEAAQVLGVAVGTVRSRIARGREQIRAALEDCR